MVWEGDPGFKIGRDWEQGQVTYVDSPMKDLIDRRRLHELNSWRQRWVDVAKPAMSRGDLEAAIAALVEARDYDWRVDSDILEAQTRLTTLEMAMAEPASFATPLAELEREPALLALATWSTLIGDKPLNLEDKNVKPFLRTDSARDWIKALAALKPQLKKIEDGKDLGDMERVYGKLGPLAGPFVHELEGGAARRRGRRTGGPSQGDLGRRASPGRWLARERLSW